MSGIVKAALLAAGLIGSTAMAVPTQWDIGSGGNGHYYEFISTDVTWQDALAAAQSMSFMGMTGYLATLTSAEENTFASATVAGGTLAWIGASDDGNEGTWTWRAGPESGQALTYFNWSGGEPNNCCNGENYVHTNWLNVGLWNDHGGPGNAGQINGYLVEFSTPVPEPTSLALFMAGALAGVGLLRRRGR